MFFGWNELPVYLSNAGTLCYRNPVYTYSSNHHILTTFRSHYLPAMHPETIAIHGKYHARKAGDPVIEPVISSTTFRHPETGLDSSGFAYTRHNNPNRQNLEQTLAALENGAQAACFSSGSAAAMAVFQSLKPGDHVLYPSDVYHGTRALLVQLFDQWGLKYQEVDMRYSENIKKAILPQTRLIWLETPSNPLLHITDIKAVRALAGNDILICVDNTWMTPLLQKPLDFGADLVVHSTTKYLGGHSDLLGGVVISKTDSEFFSKVRTNQQLGGAVPSPQDCWMLSRSLKSLPARMHLHQENARKVAAFLKQHPKVLQVYYPGLTDHPGYDISQKQCTGPGAMISFSVDGSGHDTLHVVNRSKIIIAATSLGGVESTWEHRKSSEGEASTTPDNLIRLSVGLEHFEDLLADIDLALK